MGNFHCPLEDDQDLLGCKSLHRGPINPSSRTISHVWEELFWKIPPLLIVLAPCQNPVFSVWILLQTTWNKCSDWNFTLKDVNGYLSIWILWKRSVHFFPFFCGSLWIQSTDSELELLSINPSFFPSIFNFCMWNWAINVNVNEVEWFEACLSSAHLGIFCLHGNT